MDGQVIEKQYIASPCRARHAEFKRVLIEGQVEAALRVMLDRTSLVAPWHDSDTALLQRSIRLIEFSSAG